MLDVKPYFYLKNEYEQDNPTDCATELVWNGANSKILSVLPVAAGEAFEEYPALNPFPPYWKLFKDITTNWMRYLGNLRNDIF